MGEIELIIMNIIVNAGDAKTHAYKALEMANVGNYEEADMEMQKAREALDIAHNAQTSLLQREANGEEIGMGILLVHSQDHLMTAITEKNLIEQIVELRKVVNTLL